MELGKQCFVHAHQLTDDSAHDIAAAVATAAVTAAAASRCAVWPYDRGTISTPKPLATLNQAALMLVGKKNTTYRRRLGRLA